MLRMLIHRLLFVSVAKDIQLILFVEIEYMEKILKLMFNEYCACLCEF